MTASLLGEEIRIVGELARELKQLQSRCSELEAELKEVKSQREKVSNQIISTMGLQAESEDGASDVKGIMIDGVGTVKISVKPYASVIDIDAFVEWAKENKVMIPRLSVASATLKSWVEEEMRLNMPMPPKEIMPVFYKASVRVNKSE